MNEKVRIITDSGCDISPQAEERYKNLLTLVPFEFTINGEKKVVRKGDTLYKLPNVEHGCVCLEEGVLLDFFTPMREDFVTE